MLLAGAGIVLLVAGPGVLPSWSHVTAGPAPANGDWWPTPFPSRTHESKSPTPRPSRSPSKSPSKSPSMSPSKSPTQSPSHTVTASPTSLPVTGGATSGTLTGLVVAGVAVTGVGGLLVRAGRRRQRSNAS
ncbi:hypothetical protein ACQP1P_17590 [Dactylosporangium sp. CA-052675]|uniref:hypothetical protein n=1 Tax=Dactylosporangium sp. CA-052675 TaxID=3239927 RepID=UPI003D91707E